jgi:hypothetical protein
MVLVHATSSRRQRKDREIAHPPAQADREPLVPLSASHRS